MNAGEIKNKVTIEKTARAPNNMGGYVETWTTLCEVWAKYRQLVGRELMQQQQINPVITVEVIVRYRTDITTDRRLVYRNQIHNILSVINVDNKNEWLKLMCEVKHSEQ